MEILVTSCSCPVKKIPSREKKWTVKHPETLGKTRGWNHIFGTFWDHTMGMLNIRGMGKMWRVNDRKLDMIYTYTWSVDGWIGGIKHCFFFRGVPSGRFSKLLPVNSIPASKKRNCGSLVGLILGPFQFVILGKHMIDSGGMWTQDVEPPQLFLSLWGGGATSFGAMNAGLNSKLISKEVEFNEPDIDWGWLRITLW